MTDYQFPKATPQLRDLLDSFGSQVAQNLNCHLIARVESFDKAKNTISASCAMKRKYSDDTIAEFPIFSDVPVITLCGGKSFISMPIKKGDWCLLLFNDRDIDSWWYSGEIREPNSPRYHALGDAIAIVGLKPANEAFSLVDDSITLNSSELPMVLKNDNGQIKISTAGKSSIKNNTASLYTILDSLMTALTTLAVDPGTHIILPTTVTAINNAKTQLAQLMEA